ncbi:hypothetical protein CK203_051359 [Vitis vinifera]|uniref:Uncharacterized protein n=1 Tax=Vitis vinifera TaxID=29760 RepID=A0A438FLT3_VITVI|nr:hypothetical protein CK203_051359 [Vitis vinifera]
MTKEIWDAVTLSCSRSGIVDQLYYLKKQMLMLRKSFRQSSSSFHNKVFAFVRGEGGHKDIMLRKLENKLPKLDNFALAT